MFYYAQTKTKATPKKWQAASDSHKTISSIKRFLSMDAANNTHSLWIAVHDKDTGQPLAVAVNHYSPERAKRLGWQDANHTPEPFKKGDMRRMFTALAAVATGCNTLVTMARATGMSKQGCIILLTQAQQQAGVKITKTQGVYTIEDWGPVVNGRSITEIFDPSIANKSKPFS